MAKWKSIGALAGDLSLQMQNTEMKKALRFYAQAENFTKEDGEYDLSSIERDEGQMARDTLRKIGALA